MEQNQQSDEILKQFNVWKIIVPVLLGLIVVIGFGFRDFDIDLIKKINWSRSTILWVFLGLLAMIIRQFFLTLRLKLVAEGRLDWKQCFDIGILWEFSSAATPSTVGGTAVALYFLSKEGLSAGRSTTYVLTTILLDGIFFVTFIPLVWFLLGSNFLSPDINFAETLLTDSPPEPSSSNGWVYFFLLGTIITVGYAAIVAYGLLVNPKSIGWMIRKFFKLPFLKRWEELGERTASDLVIASKGIRDKKAGYWLSNLGVTYIIWVMRLAMVNITLLAVMTIGNHLFILGRSLILYLVMLLSPTPGAGGVAEGTFIWLLKDFIPEGSGAVLALLWRFISFYIFLPIGLILLPQWLRKVYNKSYQAKLKERNLALKSGS